jgi:hypothetical protein
VKLSIKAELAYSFADATQIIANIEASHTSDQSVLSETLDFQPPAKILSDKSPCGDRRIRASLSGDVNIRYVAVVENNVRRLLPKYGRQHLWSDLPSEVERSAALWPAPGVRPGGAMSYFGCRSKFKVKAAVWLK